MDKEEPMSKHKHKNYFNTPGVQNTPSEAPEFVESNDTAPEVEVMPEPEEAVVEPPKGPIGDVGKPGPRGTEFIPASEEPIEKVDAEEVKFFHVRPTHYVNLRTSATTAALSVKVLNPTDLLLASDSTADPEWFSIWDINKNLMGFAMKKFFTRIED